MRLHLLIELLPAETPAVEVSNQVENSWVIYSSLENKKTALP